MVVFYKAEHNKVDLKLFLQVKGLKKKTLFTIFMYDDILHINDLSSVIWHNGVFN